MKAIWQKENGERAAHEIVFEPAQPGHKGWAEYQSALWQITEITKVLKREGFRLTYAKSD